MESSSAPISSSAEKQQRWATGTFLRALSALLNYSKLTSIAVPARSQRTLLAPFNGKMSQLLSPALVPGAACPGCTVVLDGECKKISH